MLSKGKKHVFITGITSGLGLGLAQMYARQGHVVCGCSIESPEEAMVVLPEEVRYFQGDVTDQRRMTEIISEFTIETGRLDLVIANAGINHKKSPTPDFIKGNKVIDVNVNGVLNTFGPAISIMKEQGHGHLAAMSSISGVMGGLPGMAIYAASKAAVYSLCRTLEVDLKAFGIYVTTLAPGFIETPLTAGNKHKMPFMMSSTDAVERIFKAIEKRRGLYMFPAPLKLATQLTNLFPDSIYKSIMRANPLKVETVKDNSENNKG